MTQQALPIPYPPGYCERIRWTKDIWPRHVKDKQGRTWLVLHIGGAPTAQQPARFCYHKPGTVEYHYIKDIEAIPA